MTTQEKYLAMLKELKARGFVRTQKELAQKLGMQEATLSLAGKGKTSSLQLLHRINDVSKGMFNVVWLVTGEGPMLAQKDEEQTFNVGMGSHSQVGGTGNTYNASVDAKELDTLRKENTELKEEVTALRKEVAEKDKTIARLEGRIETYKEMLAK